MLTLSADLLTRTTSTIFEAAGTPTDIAEFMASSLVGANLAGHDSHGVIQIPGYIAMIQDGRMLPAVRPEVTQEGASIIRVDGGWGFGQYTAHASMDLAIQKAKRNQLALVTTTRVSHIGRLGEWAEQAANAGVIGMLGVSWGAGPYAGTPYGGAGRVLSTNPISFGIPLQDRPPFILDFATTAVAEGKLRVTLTTEVEGLTIYYSFDDFYPDPYYPSYTGTFSIPKDAANIKVITYRNGKPIGKMITMPVAELQKRADKAEKKKPA